MLTLFSISKLLATGKENSVLLRKPADKDNEMKKYNERVIKLNEIIKLGLNNEIMITF